MKFNKREKKEMNSMGKGMGNWNMKLHLGRVLTDKEDNKDKCCSEDSFEEEALGHSHVAWQKCGSSICFFLWFEKKNVFKTDFPGYGLGRKKHTANGKTAMTRKGKEEKKKWKLKAILKSNQYKLQQLIPSIVRRCTKFHQQWESYGATWKQMWSVFWVNKVIQTCKY